MLRWGLLTLLFLSFWWGAGSLWAQPELSADEPIEFDTERGVLVARGNATFTEEDITIIADEIVYDRQEERATATGNVRVHRGGTYAVARKLTLDLASRTFVAEDFRLAAPPLYVSGERMTGGFEEVTVENGVYFYGEPAWLSPQAKVPGTELIPGEQIRIERAVIRIGRQPILFLPSFTKQLDEDESPLNTEARAGYSGNLGLFVQTQTLVPLVDRWRVGAVLDGYTKRGLLYGPAASYEKTTENGLTDWDGYFGVINDNGSLGEDILDRSIDRTRYFGESRLFARRGSVEVLGTLSWWSDSEVTRDFRPELYDESREPDNFLEGLWTGGDWIVEATLRASPNDFNQVVQRLPELRVHRLPTQLLATPLFHRAQASAARLSVRDPLGPDFDSDRLDLAYELAWPIRVAEGIDFRPVASGRVTHYANAVGEDTYTRTLGEVGFDAFAAAFATWDLQNETWGIDGLRHRLRPFVQYRFTPAADSGQARIPLADDDAFSVHRETLSLYDTRNLDELGERNVLRVGIENRLETRHREYGAFDLATLHLYQDVDFEPPADEGTFSRLNLESTLQPAPWLRFGATVRYDPDNLRMDAWRARVTVIDGDIWRVSLDSFQLDNRIEEYNLRGYYQWSPNVGSTVRLRWDARENRLTEQTYAVLQRLSRVWQLTYEVSFRTGAERESDFSFRVRAELLTL